jgi:hypothetical protein
MQSEASGMTPRFRFLASRKVDCFCRELQIIFSYFGIILQSDVDRKLNEPGLSDCQSQFIQIATKSFASC